MKTEYRIIVTATFATAEERDKMAVVLEDKMMSDVRNSGIAKRADLTKDDYLINDQVTKQLF